jgi:NAD(P)-dependent dehydrogenase (short-subunit alcohol dehydrogenase family)
MGTTSLSGKVVAVTGGFGALGQAVAATLVGYGARVASADQAPAPASGVTSPLDSTGKSSRGYSRDVGFHVSTQFTHRGGIVQSPTAVLMPLAGWLPRLSLK